jgi:phage shock protein E
MYRYHIYFLLPFLVVFFYFLYRYAVSGALHISAEEAKRKLAAYEFDTVLDVRSNLEYNLGHYPNAKHIPIQDLKTRVPNEIPDPSTRILIYCNTGQRSRAASEILYGLGYKNVRYISGTYMSLR